MIYGSVCSGIEAATQAWEPIGWRPSFFSEIDKSPRLVLSHHYPAVPLHGDFTTIQRDQYEPIQLLMGGTPCQSFSLAGLRAGLADPRGNLMLEFGALANRLRPQWIGWENVPGVLSSNGGRDFGAFLAMLGVIGYGFAYRVLDAQYFGVPQRRRRVFVVGYLGDWRPAGAVLFERHSLSGNYPARGEKETPTAERPGGDAAECGRIKTFDRQGNYKYGTASVASTVEARDHKMFTDLVTHHVYETHPHDSRVKDMGDVCQSVTARWGTGGGNVPIVRESSVYAIAGNIIGRTEGNGGNGNGYDDSGVSYTLTTADIHAVAYRTNGKSEVMDQGDISACLNTQTDQSSQILHHRARVRRLTEIECERLQGFPDNYTKVSGVASGNRYKMLGNSMAVPCIRYLGERIKLVEELLHVVA